MRITAKLIAISAVTVATLVVLGPAFIWSFREVANARSDFTLADEIQSNFFERTSLRDQYFLYREDYIRQRWHESKDKTYRLLRLAKVKFHHLEDQQIIDNLLTATAESVSIFDRLVANSDELRRAARNREIREELDKRLASQILLKATAIRDTVISLRELSAQRVEQTYKHLAIVVGLFASTLAAIAFLISVSLVTLVRKRLAPLHEGARTITGGNLTYRIKSGGSDEFADLAKSINTMTDVLVAEIQVRELAETALRVSEGNLRVAQEAGRIGSYAFDIPADTWRSSSMMDEILGIGVNFPRTLASWTQILHPAEREQINSYFREIVAEHRPFEREYRIVRVSDGVERWVLGQGKIEYRADGEVMRMTGIIQDITERKRLESSLVDQKEHLRTLVATIPVGVFETDETGKCIFVNERWSDITGLSLEAARGDGWAKALHPEDRDNVYAEWTASAAEERSFNLEYRFLHPDGRITWVLGRSDKYSSATEELLGYIGSITDITEQKRAAGERAELEAKLRESQKMEALGTMAGGVAHDFNNALAAILGNLELARQDVGAGHAALVSLDEIGKAGRRAKDLVQQILAFGRRQTLDRKATTLSLVVVESARLVRATLPSEVRLNVECSTDTPVVLADATQIKQILLNLCQNALHAVLGQGRPGVIDIRLENYMQAQERHNRPAGHYACLTVRDNGSGMDEAIRSHMFEPFFTTKPKGKGTGLGLSVVHGIVAAHEASIELDSAVGNGTEFRIYFPALEIRLPAPAKAGSDTVPIDGGGKHVLYVDDEEAIIFLMTRLLERQGYRVSGYTDPREALAAARADPDQFDIAVTDYSMPGMSGLEVAIALREIRPDLPVVLASGYITEELRKQAPEAGVRELIYKPDTVEELCEAVARFANSDSGKKY